MGRTALVTGSNGFIGSHLVEWLQERGDHPYAMVRETSNTANLEASGAELRYASLADVDSLVQAMKGVSIVYHVAGRTAAYDVQTLSASNAQGTANVLAAAALAGVERVLVVSSLEAAGASHHGTARAEHHAPTPFTRYGSSKLAGEHEAWKAVQTDAPFEVVIVRPPLVYGPRDLDVLQMIQSSNSRVVARPGFRDGWISAVHSHDLVRGIVLAAEQGKALPKEPDAHALAGHGKPYDDGQHEHRLGEGIYFLDDGGQHTIKSFGHQAAHALGKKAITLPIPYPIAWIAGAANEWLFKALGKPCPAYNLDKVTASFAEGWWCDSSKARAELGYEPSMPLEQGLEQTVRWLRDNRVL
jgi:nucleoside-diphosphate-sugar epimerase